MFNCRTNKVIKLSLLKLSFIFWSSMFVFTFLPDVSSSIFVLHCLIPISWALMSKILLWPVVSLHTFSSHSVFSLLLPPHLVTRPLERSVEFPLSQRRRQSEPHKDPQWTPSALTPPFAPSLHSCTQTHTENTHRPLLLFALSSFGSSHGSVTRSPQTFSPCCP